ncbi:MAG: DNA double-strand break repair nuclease NurA [Anaerolineales bacterium]|nr:DNA double-strand break repair nuclease NurA [Anaerolineales bacterium]
MTLELSRLTHQVVDMGADAAARQREQAELIVLARAWLAEYAAAGSELRQAALASRAAVPVGEPLNATTAEPAIPEQLSIVGADGTQMLPDRHGQAYYYLINVGSLVYRQGSGEAPVAASSPFLGYSAADLYDEGLLVEGNVLDLRRDLAEVTQLADLCEAEAARASAAGLTQPVVALVDGTLVLWVLEDRSPQWQQAKVHAYLDQLDRIRRAGAGVAAFTSRPRRTEVTRLLHLAHLKGDAKRAAQEPNPLERLPDRELFGELPAGARSALFISPWPMNQAHYAPRGHTIHFCYVNLAEQGHNPVIARIEMPAWVVEDPALLALVHGSVVAQARITGDYPYVLARADELAFISGPERQALEDMIATSLLRAGVMVAPSPKAYQKTLTRQGRRDRRR